MSDNTGFATAGEETASLTVAARSLLDQLTLARATELARAGRYAEAEKILSADADETKHAPAALDLLAKMRAQQGHLAEAEKLWTRASQLEPSNNAYPIALRRAAALQQGSRRLGFMRPLIACVVLGALVGMWWLYRQNTKRVQNSSAQTTPAQVSSPSGQQVPSPEPTTKQDSAQAAAPLVLNELNVRGVKTRMEAPGVLLVTFDDGLFDRGLNLKPDARERLKELGRQLKPYAATRAIEIIGMTDDLPVPRNSLYPDNASLGMERARMVYYFLRLTSGLESQLFTIGSDVDRRLSASNDTPVNRALNRTVVLRISTR
jgi:flagellar motor protein MotB